MDFPDPVLDRQSPRWFSLFLSLFSSFLSLFQREVKARWEMPEQGLTDDGERLLLDLCRDIDASSPLSVIRPT